jgi:DNA-binding transcriptional LysR family regulator
MIEKLDLLLHLARERHFGKAALAAGVSQPTLSSAVKSLEEQLGVAIVERGSRFRGFTSEGGGVCSAGRGS